MNDFSKIKNKVFIAIGAIIFIILLAFIINRILLVNKQFPSSTIEKYTESESFHIDDITLKVNVLSLFRDDEIGEIVPRYLDAENNEDLVIADSTILMLVNITLTNQTLDEKEIPLYEFYLQKNTWYNGIDASYYNELNDDNKLLLSLLPGDEVTINIPYLAYDFQFNNSNEWNNMKKDMFELVLRTYPLKQIVCFS